MIRVKRQPVGQYTFTVATVDDDGVPVTAAAPFTATVVDGDGVVIVTPVVTYANGVLTAHVAVDALPLLDTYLIVWSATVSGVAWQWTSEVELCGGYLFEIADLRAFDRQFVDPVKWPTERLRRARVWVENTIEGSRAARVAFVPRGRRVSVDGTNRTDLVVPDFEVRQVHAITADGIDLTSGQLDSVTVDDNVVWRGTAWAAGKRNIHLHYEHGFDRPPGAISRAALLLAREYLIQSDLPGRATATSVGDQMFRLTIAGRDGVTGLPEVDAAIEQFGRRGFGIA